MFCQVQHNDCFHKISYSLRTWNAQSPKLKPQKIHDNKFNTWHKEHVLQNTWHNQHQSSHTVNIIRMRNQIIDIKKVRYYIKWRYHHNRTTDTIRVTTLGTSQLTNQLIVNLPRCPHKTIISFGTPNNINLLDPIWTVFTTTVSENILQDSVTMVTDKP